MLKKNREKTGYIKLTPEERMAHRKENFKKYYLIHREYFLQKSRYYRCTGVDCKGPSFYKNLLIKEIYELSKLKKSNGVSFSQVILEFE